MNRFQNNEPKDAGKEYAQYLAHIGAKQELDRLADIVVDPSSLAYRADNCCKIIVCKHHIGNVFRNVRARNSHADSDIRIFDAWRVVDAVPRHGGDTTVFPPCVNDTDFMFRLNPCIHTELCNPAVQFFVAHFIQLRTCDGLRLILDNSELFCNRNRRIAVVARNHNGADSGALTFLDRSLYLRTDRIDHSGQTDENQIVFRGLGGRLFRQCIILTHRGAQDAEGFVRHFFVCR